MADRFELVAKFNFGGAHLQSHLVAFFDKIDNFVGNVLNSFPGREAIKAFQTSWFRSTGVLYSRQNVSGDIGNKGNMITVLVSLVSRVAEYLRVEVSVVGFEDNGGQQNVINAAVLCGKCQSREQKLMSETKLRKSLSCWMGRQWQELRRPLRVSSMCFLVSRAARLCQSGGGSCATRHSLVEGDRAIVAF
eukprot:1142275-Pelagomonas_calceolata.AAC.1